MMGILLLPSELLIEIFASSAQQEPLISLRLRCVCKWWKSVVDNAPKVWQRLLLNDEFASSRARAVLWMERSQPLPFDIDLHISDPDMVLAHLSPLFASIDRWRSVTLRSAWEIQLNGLHLDLLTLQALSVDLRSSEPEGLVDDVEIAPSPLSKFNFAPCQNKPYHYAINITMAQLPEPRLLNPLHFTYLELSEDHFSHTHTHTFHVLSFLTMFPVLQSFTFTGLPYEDEPYTTSYPLVHLPHLHTLNLRNTCSVRAILSHLCVPQLRVLYLYHLNVDFHLSQSGAGVALPEPGESADEANDFSQSPWSDLSVGMGLRSLITRCNPPIRVLEMDFSDMRTKDFKFIFDRLHTIQEFMIVASDMSDTVINLLRPYYRPPKHGEEPAVRLPRLTRFELFNCQRLSGQAVVDALSTRVALTDQMTPNHTLTDVSVINCDGFTSLHGPILSKVLGGRLRLD